MLGVNRAHVLVNAVSPVFMSRAQFPTSTTCCILPGLVHLSFFLIDDCNVNCLIVLHLFLFSLNEFIRMKS